jgi:hypothetical protein
MPNLNPLTLTLNPNTALGLYYEMKEKQVQVCLFDLYFCLCPSANPMTLKPLTLTLGGLKLNIYLILTLTLYPFTLHA